MRKKQNKSLVELLIDLGSVNRRLERLNDPAYIEAEAARVFADTKYTPEKIADDIQNILNVYG